ncbi:MAG: Hsp70 family protein [Phycisphaerae bacterium]|nr:Hsp70 family protein [Phycisphaerae bacterium]
MKNKGNTSQSQNYLGVDLGTTTSQIAIVDSTGVVQVLTNLDGDLVTQSLVSVAGDRPTVGKTAKHDRFFEPEKVAEQFKKHMATVTEDGKPISVVTGNDGSELTAVQLSAILLAYLKESAEKRLGQAIENVVISVPAYFERIARQATKDAGKIAGFKQVHIVDEPTAGATYYGLSKGIDQKIAVFDLGGGTFDICILQLKSNGSIAPIAADGDPECGGSNVDEAIFQEVCKFVNEKGGKVDPSKDLSWWCETLDWCNQGKEALAYKDSTIIPVKVGKERHSFNLTYDQMKEYSADIIETLEKCCERVLKKANLTGQDIDCIILIGGSSRLRFVQEIVKKMFGKDPVTDTDPDMAVAKGNAILAAAYFSDPDSTLLIEGDHFLAGTLKPKAIVGRDLCVAAITHQNGKNDRNEYNVPIIPSTAKLPFEAKEYFTPIDSQSRNVCVKLIDGPPKELSSNFKPLQEAEISIQPTNEEDNDDRIEFMVAMDTEGMVDIKVRDVKLNKPVPIKFKFGVGLSEEDLNEQREQLLARHNI